MNFSLIKIKSTPTRRKEKSLLLRHALEMVFAKIDAFGLDGRSARKTEDTSALIVLEK